MTKKPVIFIHFFGNLFAEEIEDDEDETPDVKRRRVIYVPSSDEEEQSEEQNEEPSEEEPNEEPSKEEPNEEEPNQEPSEEESALNDAEYYGPADCPNCYQHFLYRCECLPPPRLVPMMKSVCLLRVNGFRILNELKKI